MPAPPILSLTDVALSFGDRPLFRELELHIGPRDRLALVGRNGSGKSSLMRLIDGSITPDAGKRFVQPGISIVKQAQEPDFGDAPTVRAYLGAGLPADRRHESFRVDAVLSETGLDPDADPRRLSGGEARRASLGRLFVDQPDLLLLDEPTNHLDLPTIEWLEQRLDGFPGAVMTISHDRAFLTQVGRQVVWLDRGAIRRLDKGFAHFDAWAESVLAQEAETRAKLNKTIAEEERWAIEGISARRKRNQGRLRRLEDLRETRAQQIKLARTPKITLDSGEVSGRIVIKAINLGFAYGDRSIVQDFSTQILRGDRVGVIGHNGAGKTTLVNLLMGRIKPDRGKVRLGTNLQPAVIDQNRTALNPSLTLRQTLCGEIGDHVAVGGRVRHVIGYLRDFLFSPRQVDQPVGALSGGERNRLLLAKELAQPSNLLVLDEPTNDLDMDTLDLLEEMLTAYDGTLLLVSHDRDFLDRVVGSTIVLEGDGKAVEYPGGYSTYLAQRPRQTVRESAKATAKPGKLATGDKPAAPAKKLSYKEERALALLPDEILKLETTIATLETRLADADFYSRDPDGFTATTKALGTARETLSRLEDQWLELEEKRSALA